MLLFVELCEEATTGESCLLASAALANITFFDSLACEMILQMGAVKILLNACSDKQRVNTAYARDQVGSIRRLACVCVCDSTGPIDRDFGFNAERVLHQGGR